MSLSIGSMMPVSGVTYTQNTKEAYPVENKSKVSDSYIGSLKGLQNAEEIEPASPVRYANAKRTEKAYNDLASTFQGVTGYDAARRGQTYEMVGRNIDLFA